MSQLMALADKITGSEWLEALIATGLKYSVPWHGHPSRWDWGVTLKSLSLAIQHDEMVRDIARGLSAEQREALYADNSEAAFRLRKALK